MYRYLLCIPSQINGLCYYVLDKSMLSEEEQNQILFALQSMEKIDYKKEYKDLYLPKTNPMFIDVPSMKFIMVEEKNICKVIK